MVLGCSARKRDLIVDNSETDISRFSSRVLSSYFRGYYRLSLSTPLLWEHPTGGVHKYPTFEGSNHPFVPPQKWHDSLASTPPERGAKKAYTFFQLYSERGQNWFWLKIFLYTFFEIYFPAVSQPTCLKIIFLRCVRARISWHDMMHKVPEDCLAYHHHHLALK